METKNSAPEEILAQLTRLSQKSGVQSTLLLNRQSGAIIRTSGLISPSPEDDAEPGLSNDADSYVNGQEERGMQSAEDVARLVVKFVDAAGSLVDGLEKDEEVRLLRVRTKKHELVIVPHAKYLLVAIHDTPPA